MLMFCCYSSRDADIVLWACAHQGKHHVAKENILLAGYQNICKKYDETSCLRFQILLFLKGGVGLS